MPALFAPIAVFIASTLSNAVARVLAAIGLAAVTYQGLSTVFSFLANQIAAQFALLSGGPLAMVALLGVDKAMTILMSSYVASWGIRGIQDNITKLIPATTTNNGG